MLAYTFYETDTRVIYYAEELANRGDEVDVIALKRPHHNDYEVINGVHVYRIQEREPNEKSLSCYIKRLMLFFFKSFYFITKKHLKEPYDLVHVHSVPDFEVFAALIPKLSGAKIILDIHDIVPEFYAAKFGASKKALLFKLLLLAEKISATFSNHVIIGNHIWRQKIIRRSVPAWKCTAMLNYPSKMWSKPVARTRADDKFLMLYPGSLNWHQGLDIVIKAMALLKDGISNIHFAVYGDGPTKRNLIQLTEQLDLTERVSFNDEVPIETVPQLMANADIGIIPKRNDKFGGEAFSTKSLEFMAVGVPIIISRTKIDDYYFNDSIVKFFEPENVDDLAKAILEMYNNKALRERLAQNALKFVEDFKWEKNKHIYLNLVDHLLKHKTKKI